MDTGILKILDGAVAGGATTSGTCHFVGDAEKIFLQFGTTDTANIVIKFQGSISESYPNFAAAQSATNHWDFIDVIDLQDGTSIDGDAGITIAADDVRNLEANVGALRWICARITTYNAGTIYLNARAY
jgi:hypothetical protein